LNEIFKKASFPLFHNSFPQVVGRKQWKIGFHPKIRQKVTKSTNLGRFVEKYVDFVENSPQMGCGKLFSSDFDGF
jgi:hypothetical protein